MSTGIEGFSFNLLYLNSVFRVLRLRLSLESPPPSPSDTKFPLARHQRGFPQRGILPLAQEFLRRRGIRPIGA